MTKHMGVAALAAGVLALGAGVAGAAPPEREPFELDCTSGTYEVDETGGNGEFTPVRVDGGGAFVPTSFEGFAGTVFAPDGVTVLDEFSEEGSVAKGSGKRGQRADVETCTFEFRGVNAGEDFDPEYPEGAIFVYGGTVRGFFSKR